MRFNEEDVRRCYKFLAHEKESEIRLIDPKKKKFPLSKFVKTEDEFVKVCKEFNETYNIYVGIQERQENGTDKKDVISVRSVILDIDAVRAEGFEKEPATDEELLECEKDCDDIIASMMTAGCETPTKVFTGNGYQIWMSIPEIKITETNRDSVETKMQQFQDLVAKRYENHGSIDKIGDLPRIIKVWGSWNIKGTDNGVRKHRLCKVDIGGERIEDKTLWKQIDELKVEQEDYTIKIGEISELEREYLPYPIQYLLYKYEHRDSKSWMRIIETLASFFRGIGLNEENSIGHIIEWSRRQPYRETGEESEIVRITKRIFKNKINCPNFEKLVMKEAGYPFFGLKDVFEGIEIDESWNKYKNPVKYYKVKRDRSSMSTIEKLKSDIKSYLLGRKRDEATELITKYILEKNSVYTTRDDIKSEIWIYKDGIYTPNGKTYIKEICRLLLEENFTVNIANDVINKIETDTYIEQDDFFNSETKEELAVENGILNIKTRTLGKFDPEKIFFNKLPVFYNPDATCPNTKKFFRDILKHSSDSEVMFELIGYCLYKDYNFEKAFMFVGGGRNGKGKTLLLMKKLLGVENCSSIPLSQITPSSTSVAELHARLANLAGDLSNSDLKDTGMFKQVTGRDLITAKRKYLRDLFFTNYAKMIFACNELPRVYDLSIGFWSRWVLLEFPYEFVQESVYNELPEKERTYKKIMDEEIIDKISTEEELSGLLNESLDGLDRLLKNREFSYTTGTKEIKEFWIRKSDSFTAFCMDSIGEDVDGCITKKDVRKAFMRYCKEHKIKGASDKAIKAILEDNYGVTESRKEILGGFYPVWEGIKWK